jgi:hypothetical protein
LQGLVQAHLDLDQSGFLLIWIKAAPAPAAQEQSMT